MKRRTFASLLAATILSPAIAAAAPSPSLQGLQTGVWNVISDADLNPNQAVVDFGSVDVGSTSPRYYRLRNVGDGFFNWTGFSSSNPQFVVRNSSGGAQGFPIPIVGGDHRDFIIRFNPTTPGTATSTITLSTNLSSINAQYTFAVTGVGLSPDARLSGRQSSSQSYATIVDGDASPRLRDGTDFDFTPVGSSTVREFRLTNTGNTPLDPGNAFFVGGSSSNFSINGLTYGNLGAGNSRDFTIRFTPSSTGVKTTTLHFVSDDPDENPYTFALRGEGVAFPNIQLRGRQSGVWNDIDDADLVPDQAVTQYGGVLFDQTSTRSFRIENSGNATLNVDSIVSSDPSFTIPGPPTSVPADDSRDFVIKFTPQVAGPVTTTITVRSDAPGDGDPYTFALAGTGLVPDARISGRPGASGGYDNIVDGETTPRTAEGTLFVVTPVGNFTERFFKLTNDGNTALDPGSAFMGGADADDFSVRNLSLSNLDATKAREFEIRFEPSSPGTKTATFNLVSDDPDENPYTFVVKGEAVAFPNINVRGLTGAGLPFDIDDGDHTPDQDVTQFGEVDLGQMESRLYRIENTGNAVLAVTSVASDNPRFTIPGPPTLVGADAHIDFVIDFRPTTHQTESAIITIESDSPGDESSYSFAVNGTGTGPEIVVEGQDRWGSWVNIHNGYRRPSTGLGTEFRDTQVTGGRSENTFRVRNTGNKNLRLTGREFTGSGEDDFSVSGLLAGNPFADVRPGRTREFTIAFDPDTEGSKLATFSIDSNDSDEDPFTFSVAGTGIARPEIRVLGPRPGSVPIPPRKLIYDGDGIPSSDDGTLFPALSIAHDSITRTFRIENPGDGVLNISSVSVDLSGEYQIVGAPSSVAAGGHEDFDLIFDPSTGGHHDATVTIASNAWMEGGFTFHQSYTFAVTGYGWDNVSAVMRVSGQGVNTRLEDGGEFLFALDFGYGVAFDTGLGFDYNYTLNLNPFWVPVEDNDPNTRLANGTDFGSPNIDLIDPLVLSNVKTVGLFRLENLGATPLEITGIEVDNEFYTVELDETWYGQPLPQPLVVQPATSEVLRVTFRPDVYGRHDATITLTTNAPGQSVYRIRVTGFGDSNGGPEIDVRQARSLGFSDLNFFLGQDDPESETQLVDIINRGNEILTLDFLTGGDPAHYSFTAFPDIVLPGQTETFEVTFTSDDYEAHEGFVRITHNDPDGDPNPIELSLRGQALDPTPWVNVYGADQTSIEDGSDTPSAASGTDFGTADAGGDGVTRTFFLENLSDFYPLILNTLNTGSPSFRIESVPTEIAPGETGQLVLTFLPTGAGEEVSHLSMNFSRGSLSPDWYNKYQFAIGGTSTEPVSAPPEIIDYRRDGSLVIFTFTNSPTETYAFEYSSDGVAWFPYETGLPGRGVPITRAFSANHTRILVRVREE